jgi:NTE family protein
MTRALCLSGGGARGSFQMGAIKCLYTRFNYRPELIVGTSVGAVNGVKLAEGSTAEDQLTAMRELESQWWSTVQPDQFFVPRPEFASVASRLLSSGPGGRFGLPLGYVGVGAALGPITGVVGTVLLAWAADQVRTLLNNLQTLNSLLLLDPVRTRISDSANLDLNAVRTGTPLFLATVSLESGRLRYVTGQGAFVEKDGVTPVASALEVADLNVGAFANDTARRQAAERLLSDYRTLWASIVLLTEETANLATPAIRRVQARDELREVVPRAEHALRQLRAAIRGVPEVTARADVITGVIASAAIPGIFDAQSIGTEHYVDGGVREVIPVDIAVRKGADQIVAISCSSNTLPDVDSFGRAGVLSCFTRALVDTALGEVTEGDLIPPNSVGVNITKIIPSFDVHDSIEVVPSLIEIAMHYGFMRAGDVMQEGLNNAQRAEAFELSDALIALRMDCFEEEQQLLWDAAANHNRIREIRMRKWAIRSVLAVRKSRGLPIPDFADRWASEWERDFRPSSANPLGMPTQWASYASLAQTTPAESPATYAPDSLTIADRSSGQLFELVRGAAFATSVEPAFGRVVTLRAGTIKHLPRIPPGRNLLVESGRTAQWFCDGRRRFSISSPSVLAAIGMTNATAATVPRGGLAQIPEGGAPFWAGGLVVVDGAGLALLELVVTQREGSNSTFLLMMLNRSQSPITVQIMDLVGFAGTAGISVEQPLGTVPPSTQRSARLRFAPTTSGTFEGTIHIQCNDTLIPLFDFPLTLVASPLGERANLSLDPTPLLFVGRVLQTQTRQLTMTNDGATAAQFQRVIVEREDISGTFLVPWSLPPAIAPGQSSQLSVSCVPKRQGRTTGTLLVETRSQTTLGFSVVDIARVELTSIATAPRIVLRLTQPPPEQPRGEILIDPTRPPLGQIGGFGAFGRIGGGRLGRLDPANLNLVPITSTPIEVNLGTVAPGATVNGSFFIGNLGDADLTVTGIVLRSGGFFGDPINFPFTVAPGEWREIAVHTGTGGLRPGDVLTGEWAVLSDDPFVPEATVAMRVRLSGPKLTASTDFVDLGFIGTGSATERQITLENQGDQPVTIDRLRWTAGRPFTVSLPATVTLPASLAAGAALVLTIGVPAMTDTGNFVDYLTISAPANIPASLIVGAQVRVQ